MVSSFFLALPNFTNVSSDQSVREGSELQLFCIASGRPAPDITWVRITSSGSASDVLHRNATWNFKNISRIDAGTYRCIADNGVGNPVSHTIRVTIECKYSVHDYLVIAKLENYAFWVPLQFRIIPSNLPALTC